MPPRKPKPTPEPPASMRPVSAFTGRPWMAIMPATKPGTSAGRLPMDSAMYAERTGTMRFMAMPPMILSMAAKEL